MEIKRSMMNVTYQGRTVKGTKMLVTSLSFDYNNPEYFEKKNSLMNFTSQHHPSTDMCAM